MCQLIATICICDPAMEMIWPIQRRRKSRERSAGNRPWRMEREVAIGSAAKEGVESAVLDRLDGGRVMVRHGSMRVIPGTRSNPLAKLSTASSFRLSTSTAWQAFGKGGFGWT